MIEINAIECVLKKSLDKFMCISCSKFSRNPGHVAMFSWPGWFLAGPVKRLCVCSVVCSKLLC